MTNQDLQELVEDLVSTYEEFSDYRETPNENKINLLYPRGVEVSDGTAKAIIKMEIEDTDFVVYQLSNISGGLSLEVA